MKAVNSLSLIIAGVPERKEAKEAGEAEGLAGGKGKGEGEVAEF